MFQPTVGFIVYGVHKDGLEDPMGTPFIDDDIIGDAKKALEKRGIKVFEHDVVVANKAEAKNAFQEMKSQDDLDCVILFTGTWVWASKLVGAIRDFARTGKGVLIWTNPGSQGWRPVGGLVMHGALDEIDVSHKFVYGGPQNQNKLDEIESYCKAAKLKNQLNMSTIGAFGGRGMGQTVGVADPSQWMKKFGIDIDTRDTLTLVETAKEISTQELDDLESRIEELFSEVPERTEVNEKSMRLYLALKKIVNQENFDMYTIQTFPGLADQYATTCFAQSMMLEEGYGTSTLRDFNTAFTVELLTRLSDDPVYYGDLQNIDLDRKEIKIIGDGACPPSLAGDVGPAKFAKHGIPTEGEAGGLAVSLVCKPGDGVLARLGRVNGEFRMIATPVSVFEPPKDQIQKRREECGIPFWPHAFVKPRGDLDELVQHWTNEYACLAYGTDIIPALEDFCDLTEIEFIRP